MRFLRIFGPVLAFAFTANDLLRGFDVESSSSRLARTRLARHLPETRSLDVVDSPAVRRSLHKYFSRASATVHIKDFQLSDIYANDFKSTDTVYNRTISFLFADPNSNTSTICTKSWTQSNSTNNYPTDYVLCDFTTAEDEAFYWKFTSWTSLGNFSIEFAHEFSDPADYPPPYDVVEYFTQPTSFSLACTARSTSTGVLTDCVAPGPLPAVVNGIAD